MSVTSNIKAREVTLDHRWFAAFLVLQAAAVALVLFGLRQVVWGFVVLGAVVLIDVVIFFFAGRPARGTDMLFSRRSAGQEY